MLHHFTAKKAKKHPTKTEERSQSPILSAQDERFLEQMISDEGPTSAHAQLDEADNTADDLAQPVVPEGGQSKNEDANPTTVEGSHVVATNRWSFLQRFASKKVRYLVDFF